MPTELIQIGPATPILQGVVYSIPSIPVEITAGAVVQSSILYTGPFTNISNGLMNGCFIKCVTGNTTVTLKKKVIGEAAVTPPVVPFNGLVSVANLVSYWKLDEATGNRLDSVGTNHLIPTNNPVGAAGKIGNGCDLELSSSQYLSTPLPLGDEDFTYTFWFKYETILDYSPMISGPDYTYTLRCSNINGALNFFLGDGSIGTISTPNISDTNWHFVVAWRDAAANTINLQYDNGILYSAATSGSMPSASTLRIGLGWGVYFDGIIDEVGLWRRVLTAAERTALYNSGNGLPYSTTDTPVAPSTLLNNLVSYWKLDETTGNRLDSKGTNHLTPTNAPVGAAGKIGNGCDFESSSSQYLSHPDLNPLGNEDFTYTFWFKRESIDAAVTLIGKDDGGTNRSYAIQLDGAGYHYFDCFVYTFARCRLYSPNSNNTNWHFLIAWYDATAHTLNLSVDDLTIGNGALGEVGLPPGPATTPVSNIGVRIGAKQQSTAENYFDGLIDEVGLWRRVLTAQERTDLYNSGNGRTYPFS